MVTQGNEERKQKVVRSRWKISLAAQAVIAILTLAPTRGQSPSETQLHPPTKPGETIVLGFLGGFERWNDENRGVRKLVLRLRDTPGYVAESFGNHRRKTAQRQLLQALDTDRNGKLDDAEKSSARIVLFGQSWGGGAAIKLARDLNRRKIPVLLTVQIDSVGKSDDTIPPNVRAAVNFFQREPLTVWGQKEIRAADPNRTRILGNIRHYYPVILSPSRPESRARRWLGGGHARMEADPVLWAEVEGLIRMAAAGGDLIVAPKLLEDGLRPPPAKSEEAAAETKPTANKTDPTR